MPETDSFLTIRESLPVNDSPKSFQKRVPISWWCVADQTMHKPCKIGLYYYAVPNLKLSLLVKKIKPSVMRSLRKETLPYENTPRITRAALRNIWCDCYGLVYCSTHEGQHSRLPFANGGDRCLLLHCDAGCTFLGMTGALKAVGRIKRRNHPTRNVRVLEINLKFNITLFQRKIMDIFYILRKKISKAQEINSKQNLSKIV
ncbi:hypothetical protein [Bartonella doshiae]|uniref:hypothetical protein n=1 Tax=Bartonella doshiae TaxID=33044 RepID=UPI000941FE0F|nr:hypothetical protein [Bartonella doshiae]